MAGTESDNTGILGRAYALLSDQNMLALIAAAAQVSLPEAREEAIKANKAGVMDIDMDTFDDLYTGLSSPEAFKGPFITLLKDVAEDILKTAGYEITADVGLIHSLDINAICYTESGSISFNFGVISMLIFWIRAAMGLYSLNTTPDDPFCTCFSEEGFIAALIAVATAIATRTIPPLRNAVRRCTCRPFHDETMSMFATLTELFVMLHEYAHLVQSETEEPTDPHEREMLADVMAIDYLSGAGLELPDAVMNAAFFLQMVRFADIVGGKGDSHDTPTHPSPKSRIDQIMASVPAGTNPTRAVFTYSWMFSRLAQQLTDPDESSLLERAFAVWSDPTMLTTLAAAIESHTDKRHDHALKSNDDGVLAIPIDIDDLKDMYKETLTPAAFKGAFITSLTKAAKGIVHVAAGYEVTADVGLTHSFGVDAFSDTEPGVAKFNFGVDAMLLIWIKSALGLHDIAMGADDPYCHCLSEGELATSMMSVPVAIATENFAPLRNTNVLTCSCRPVFDEALSLLVTMTELFLMLRKYAHMVQSRTEVPADAYEQEKLADSMAIDYLVGVGVERRDAVMYAGFFLQIIRMAYIVDGKGESYATPSYPSPATRIDAIMASLPGDTDPASEVFAYSAMFNLLAAELTVQGAELRKVWGTGEA